MRSVLVIGLGRFGSSIAKELYRLGNEVMAVDAVEATVSEIASEVTHSFVGNCADERVIRSLGVHNFDVVVVAMATDIQASIMATLLVKEMGAKFIIAKANGDNHAAVLRKVGADQVVFPEQDLAKRTAHAINSPSVFEYIELSPKYSILEINAPKTWVTKTIRELNIRAKYNLYILGIHSLSSDLIVMPNADHMICEDEKLFIVGSNDDLAKIPG